MNKLRDKKTGQYISMKKIPEVDTKNVIDIWCCEEPVKQESSDWQLDFTIKVLVIIFLLVSTFYLLQRM